MEQQERQRAASQSGFQAPFGLSSGSFSTSNPAIATQQQQQAHVDPVRLRGLPGYSNSPDFLASRLGSQQTNNSPAGAGVRQFGLASHRPSAPIPSTPASASKPYQSRERVYYQSSNLSASVAPGNGPGRSASLNMPLFSSSSSHRPLSAAEVKAEAPPTGSLYDDPFSPERRPIGGNPAQIQSSKEIDYLSGMVAASPNRVLTSNFIDSFPREQTIDPMNTWVTVFGFSGSQAPAVLAYFQTLGTVLKTELGQRNWLHIQYDSPWAAQKALLKNGSVLPSAGSCMIGVLPTPKAMEQVGQASASFMSPLKKGAETAGTPFGPQAVLPKSSLRTSIDVSGVPQTPGFPQATMYSSTPGAQFPVGTVPTAPVTGASIFANEAAKERAVQMGSEAALANGSEGLVTKVFNYIFGF